MPIDIPFNWKPREYQKPLCHYLEKGGKRAVVAWHRRAGKDEVALHWAAYAAQKRPATYWHMLPEAAQARKAIWNAINPHTGKRRIDEVFPKEIRANTNETEMFIRFLSGSTWQVVGSDNFNSLVGSPPAGVVGSEWALANPLAWAYLRPILAENNGWSVFISTPRGRNHFHKMLVGAKDDPATFNQVLTAEDTNVFTPEALQRELREFQNEYGEEQGKSLFMQEYYCSFDSAILGSVYGEWMQKAEKSNRICKVEHDASLPVFTAWDLGRTDATAIWFYQQAKNEIRFIDYWEANGKDPYQLCEQLYGREIIIKSRHPVSGAITDWSLGGNIDGASHRQKYNYSKHYVPHDAAYKLLAASGRSIVQQSHEFGVKMFVVPATSQQNGITAARKALEFSWFNKDSEGICHAIECLKNYHRKWDEKKQDYNDTPYHDWSSHCADALEIVGQVWKNPSTEPPKDKPRFLHEATFDEVMWPVEDKIHFTDRI